MAITASGIGSGVDVEGLVSQLIASEKDPLEKRIEQKEATFDAKLSGLGTLKSALTSFQDSVKDLSDLSTFQTRKVDTNQEELFSGSADSSAVSGSYEIEVTRLAQAHKLMSAGFSDKDTDVGTGDLTISTGTDSSFTINIDDSNKTLDGISQAINSAADNPGVTATIINVDDGLGGTVSKLVISASEMGSDYALKVEVANDGDNDDTDTAGLSQLVYVAAAGGVRNMTELTALADLDAQFNLDGQAVTYSSNTVKDVIQGVTIYLDKAEPGTKGTLAVTTDSMSVSESLSVFVGNYNTLLDAMDSLSTYDAETGEASILLGDSTLRSVESQVRQVMSSRMIGEVFTTLYDVGLSAGEDGKLSLNSSRFDAAAAKNLEAIGSLFASDDGIATQLDTVLSGFLESGGRFDARVDGIQSSLSELGDQRGVLERRMDKLEERYRAQFTAMDLLVSQLQSTSGYLGSQLENLPKIGGNK